MPKNGVKRRQLFVAQNFGDSDDDFDYDTDPGVSEEEPEDNKRKPIDPNFTPEWSQNAFSRFYTPNYPILDSELEGLPEFQKILKSYQHADAIAFAANSWNFSKRRHVESRDVTTQNFGTVPTFCPSDRGIRAFYRVVTSSDTRYILTACHQNLHGRARGDLRFLEINDKTECIGASSSVIGQLFLGDIVCVTALARTEHFEERFMPTKVKDVVLDVEMKCHWFVSKMSICPREIARNRKFAIMDNGSAIVKGYGDAMSVKIDKSIIMDPDKVYIGDVFIPLKMDCNFTEDHHSGDLNRMIQLSDDFPMVPWSQGTIFDYSVSTKFTEMFDAGTDAFKNPQTMPVAAETVEFCALIGYSAAKTVFSAHDDSRKFVIRNAKRDEKTENLVRFSIDNPKNEPTDGFWHSNGRIRFSGKNLGGGNSKFSNLGAKSKVGGANAMIETVICEGAELRIVARLSRDTPDDVDFSSDVISVQQRKPFETELIQDGFFSLMDSESNGKRIIRTLYGGQKMVENAKIYGEKYIFPAKPSIQLNEYQCEYVSRVLEGTPIVLANSPFGCGKSMTIVTAALYLFEKHKKDGWKNGKPQQLLITQSNYASVNLVDIAMKTTDRVKDVKFLRYVSESNWKEMPDACRTDWDMPKLMNDTFIKWATNTNKEVKFPALRVTVVAQIVSYVTKTLGIHPSRLNPLAMNSYKEAIGLRPPWPRQLLETFFLLFHPDIIIVTASSLPGLLSTQFIHKNLISNVQIDEASQLAEYTLLSLLTLLPSARFGLIGDIHQLAPYCEEELTGKLKDYGIGNAMERAVKESMFPQVILKCVYRCHPVITSLLGELFYNSEIISGISAENRSEFMKNRPHFWPNPDFPIMVVDNKAPAQAMGTSFANSTERIIVKQIIDFLTETERKKYVISPQDVGVISYYSAQTSMLTDALRDVGVKCGTVDSFQGSEREIIVLCCTNDDIQEFMQVKNRLNVAMSRSKQVTILIGNVEMLRKVQYWGTIIERCEANGCVVDTSKYPFRVMPPGTQPTNKAKNSKKSASRKNEAVSKLAKELQDIVSLETNKKKKGKK